ncbi:putative RNA-directed DNA polymerase from transposon BS [Trichonephila clavipes]|nr:putative RNA-directed DNA polymerase from transposon BS [Trichonephila clavipes]
MRSVRDQSPSFPIDVLGISLQRVPHVEAWRVGCHLSSPPRHSTGVPNDTVCMPILEYGVLVYCSVSVTNLQKLEKVHLSAARIITGLKNTCPRDIVLFEADLQPLSLRRRACLTKYYNKIVSLDSRNRTSKIGVITRDSGETVLSAKWSTLTLPLMLWDLIICHNVLTQRMILTGSSSIQNYTSTRE